MRNLLAICLAITVINLIACGDKSSGTPFRVAGDSATSNNVSLRIERFGKGEIRDADGNLRCTDAICDADLQKGKSLKLIAVPDSGWRLNKWAGCDQVVNDMCIITMQTSRTAFPTFERTAPPSIHNNVYLLTLSDIRQIESILDGAIIFSPNATKMARIKPGTVLISTNNEGFARRVTDVHAPKNSKITLTTQTVPLADVIREGTIVYNSPLTTKSVAHVKRVPGIQYREAQTQSPTFSFDVDVELDDGIHIKGAVDLQITPDFAISIGLQGVQEMKFAVRVAARPSLEVSVEKSLADIDQEIKLPIPTLHFAPITVGPVVLTPAVGATLLVKASTGGKVTTEGWIDLQATAGAHFVKSIGWNGIGEEDIDGNFVPFDRQATAKIDIMAGPEFSIKVYGVAGPAINVGPFVKGESAYSFATDCWDNSIIVGGRASASIKGKILGWKLKALNLTVLEGAQQIYSDSGGKCKGLPNRAPENIKIVKSLPRQLYLEWSIHDSTPGHRYVIYRDNEKIATTYNTKYIDQDLEPETNYCYYIVAVKDDQSSSPSRRVCGSTKPNIDDIPPETPRLLTAETVSSSAVRLKWNPSHDRNGSVSYLISLADTGEIAEYSEANTKVLTRLKPGTEYCFRVLAIDEAGNASDRSNRACARTQSTGSYRVRIRCDAQSYYAVDTTMDLDIDYTSSVSVVGTAVDYDGEPLSYVLTGTYNADSRRLGGRIDWTFDESDCLRVDTFRAKLMELDTGDIPMTQTSVCGCNAMIRFTKGRGHQSRSVIPEGPPKSKGRQALLDESSTYTHSSQ